MDDSVRLEKLMRGHRDVPLAKELNNEAFPDNERIDIDDMFAFGNDGKTDILAVYHEDVFAGLFVIRLHTGIAYIAYFAVCREKRSKGIGGKALGELIGYYPGRQVIVDFESVHENCGNLSQRERRRAFYLRNGFSPSGWYMFYMETEFEIAFTGDTFDRQGFGEMLAYIHSLAPEFDPHMYRKDEI